MTSPLLPAEETPCRQLAADQGLTAVKVPVSVPACSYSIASVAADAGCSSELGYEYIFAMFDVHPIPMSLCPRSCWKILHKIMIHNNCRSHGSTAELGRNSDQNKNQVKHTNPNYLIAQTLADPGNISCSSNPPPQSSPGDGCVVLKMCVSASGNQHFISIFLW